MPLWNAWEYIEPSGWKALDLQFAKLARRMWIIHRGSENAPNTSDFLTPRRDWREFDPDLREEMEADRLVRNLKAVMRGEPSGQKSH